MNRNPIRTMLLIAGLAVAVAVPLFAQTATPHPAAPATAEPQAGAAATGEPQGGEPPAAEPPATGPAATGPATGPVAAEPAADPASAPTATAAGTGDPGATPATASQALGGVVSQTAEAVKSGGAGVAEQGRQVWQQALLPMWQRFSAAVPVVLKALVLLAVFWIVAVVLGALVKKALDLTKLDERAARELGLGKMLEPGDKPARSISAIAGGAVKWVILAFGFLAFFNALQLGMVAGPLENILNKITGAIPSLILAAVILLAYWVVGTLLKLAASKGLQAVGFDDKAGKYIATREIKGEQVGPSAMVGRLVFYVVLLFGIPPFLDALGQQSLVSPLRDMLAKVLDFLPNVIGALILLFIGRIIASIIREVVTNFLAAVGVDSFAERFGFGGEDSRKVSEIGGAVAFFFVILPIVVAAVDSLQMKAISEPVKSTLEQLLSAIPLLFVAIVIVAVGYFIAKAVRGIVESFLAGVGFDSLPERFGLPFLKPKEGGASLSAIGGTVVMAIILLLTAEQALATLQLVELSSLVGDLIGFLPSLIVGLVIILAALSLGSYVGGLVARAMAGSEQAALLSGIAKWAIVFLGFSMGLSQLGVGREILTVAVSAILGGTALAIGLAFGLGGRDRAKEIIDKRSAGG